MSLYILNEKKKLIEGSVEINYVSFQFPYFQSRLFLNNFGVLFIMCPSFCVPQRPKAPTTNAASQCILISTKLQFCRFNVNFRPQSTIIRICMVIFQKACKTVVYQLQSFKFKFIREACNFQKGQALFYSYYLKIVWLIDSFCFHAFDNLIC